MYDQIRQDNIVGSRRFSNFFWTFFLSIGGLLFLLAGISSYSKINLLPFTDTTELVFIPQGIVMMFYGTLSLGLSIYIGVTLFWDIGGGYNDNAVFVGVVAGYDTPAPKEAFQRGTLSAASVTKQQFRRMRIIAKAFTDVLPIGQVYGINELSADRTTVSRSGPGVSVEAIRAHIDKDVIGMGEVISNGKFFTTEELKAKIESKLEGED